MEEQRKIANVVRECLGLAAEVWGCSELTQDHMTAALNLIALLSQSLPITSKAVSG